MTGWTKHYSDGTKYIGDDYKVAAKLVSWRNSKNDDINAVDLKSFDKLLKIVGYGEYWQSDTYETIYPGSKSIIVKRRIMKKIENFDKFFREIKTQDKLIVYFNNTDKGGGQFNFINFQDYNKWLVIEHSVTSNTLLSYIKDQKF